MYVGIDLGGTKIAFAVIDAEHGTVHERHVIATHSEMGAAAVLERMVAVLVPLVERFPQVAAIGVGVPGVFDDESGETLFLPNLVGTWHGVPVRAVLSAAVDRPLWLINDARAFVLGEALHGAGRGHANVVGFTIGTGIGGGVVMHRQLYLGIRGTAGEFGHQTLALDGPRCGCGNVGCLEAFASGSAMVRAAEAAIAAGTAPQLAHVVAQGQVLTPALMMAVQDVVIRDIMASALRYLGAGVANAVSMFSPDAVILGGSVSNLGEPLRAAVVDIVQARCRATPVADIAICLASLGGDAGVMGAACWAAHRNGDRQVAGLFGA